MKTNLFSPADLAGILKKLPLRRDGLIPLISIVGPTGTGKSALALALARTLGPERVAVINADSRQIYSDFPIITAQPDKDEQAVCPHFLYGFLPTEEKLGAGGFADRAREVVSREDACGKLCILVGGTGLYLKSLLHGIAPIPPVPPEIDLLWQQRLNLEGSQALHRLLAEKDPAYAAKIHPNDPQRITRALAVYQATGKTFTWWHEQPLPQSPYAPLTLGLTFSMPELSLRLKARIDSMIEKGALEEARTAAQNCPDENAPGWSGIGCAELLAHIRGETGLDEAKALWLKNTRAYAKRQMTWFRADTSVLWL